MMARAVRCAALALALAFQPAELAVVHATDRCRHEAAFVRPSATGLAPSVVLRGGSAFCAQIRTPVQAILATKGGSPVQTSPQNEEVLSCSLKGLVPRLLAPALLLALSVGFPTVSPAELTTEQKVAANVWSVVDQGFVDRSFNNQDWMKIRQSVVKKNYASRDEAYETISNDLLKPLGDQYTRFINPTKYEALRNSIVGGKGQDVSGIGVTLSIDKKAQRVKIVDTIEGSPAAKAELERGSIITEVNKVRVDDGKATPEDVAALVRGPVGTIAKVKFIEPGSPDDEYEVDIQRNKFTVRPVTHGVNGKTGWIKIKQFDTQTAELVKGAVEENLKKGADCHVVDLRDNAGGFFRAGVDTAALFLEEGSAVVSVVNKDGLQDAFKAEKEGIDTENPLFLLVNENTASASEIMTGALKDNERAKIVGVKTFGKGVVQTVTPLVDGSGVAVTIARYETPNKIDINKKGIEVDGPASKTSMCPDAYPNL